MKKNIMIIDDSALMRRVLSDIINTTEQYQVVYAAVNGKDGLEAMQRLTPIHFIFLDINMPVMDGVELLRKMKQNNPDSYGCIQYSSGTFQCRDD